jgi:hypothetical protein
VQEKPTRFPELAGANAFAFKAGDAGVDAPGVQGLGNPGGRDLLWRNNGHRR